MIARIALAALGVLAAPAADVDVDVWRAEVQAYRDAREERLRSPDGWLSLVGLHWLDEGVSRFGTAPDADVVLPVGTAPAHAGSLVLEGGQVRLEPADGVPLTVNGEPARARELASDSSGSPDVLRIGELTFYVIERSGRFGIRVKDPNSPVRTGFEGLDYFEIDPAWRIVADWVPYDPPQKMKIASVTGGSTEAEAPGFARFRVGEREFTLHPMPAGDDRYWFLFRDGTSGEETYGAGRYLYTGREQDGKLVIDFNRAYNPPCVFTPYATCPLPPKRNRLDVRIEAGEKTYAAHRSGSVK